MDNKKQINAVGITLIILGVLITLASTAVFIIGVIKYAYTSIFISFFLIVFFIFAIFVGIGIRNKKRWSRKLGIFYAIILLPILPIGIWFLKVLFDKETKRLMYF